MSNALVSFGLFLVGVVAIVRGVALWSLAGAWVASGCICLVLAFWPLIAKRIL